MLRCPLCLKELTPTDKIRLVCLKHDAGERGNDASKIPEPEVHEIPREESREGKTRLKTGLLSELVCKQGGGTCGQDFWSGVFLSHVGCSVRHPWAGAGAQRTASGAAAGRAARGRSSVPWEEGTPEPARPPPAEVPTPAASTVSGDVVQMGTPYDAFTTAILEGVRITHAMVGALWRLPKKNPEMWFPVAMLRAMNTSGSQVSAVVQVSGSTGAGKTVFSLQAQHLLGYRVPGEDDLPHFDMETYIHMSDAACLANAHAYLMASQAQRSAKNPMPTRALLDNIHSVVGDVKAVFFKLPESVVVKKPRIDWRQMFSFVGANAKSDGAKRSWQTLMFFDVPGEMVENPASAPILSSISAAAHRVAVVINAEDLLSHGGSGESLRVASQELSRLRKTANPKPACIIVTQMDKVRRDVSEEDWQAIGKTARTGKGGARLLKKWVQALRRRHKDIADVFLASAATSRTPVFFLWTTGLGDGGGEEVSAPTSYGLRPIVSWCLDQPQESIFVRVASPDEDEDQEEVPQTRPRH